MSNDFDLIVIGAGSGGVRASRMASQLGKRVAVVEDSYYGGTCVNVGCVPKKLFVYGSHFGEDFKAAAGFGWQVKDASLDWPTLRDNKTREIERLQGIYATLLSKAGVTVLDGHGTITGPNTVRVNGTDYHAANILIASGSKPRMPDIPGKEFVISSNEAFYLDALPKKMVIVGGGYIAVEFAGIFHGLGVETHLLYRGDLFLRGFDLEVREFLRDEMLKKGIHLHFNTDITQVVQADTLAATKYVAHLNTGEQLQVDELMYAIGRTPRTEGLGIENTSIHLDASGAIDVDENFRTSEPSVYAIGDVIDRVQLTPVALKEAMALVAHLYEGKAVNISYDRIPTAVFSQPNIGTVGLSEEQARKEVAEVEVYTSQFTHMKHSLSGINEKTFMKLVVDKQTRRVLGCHMVGADAGEIIQGLGVALQAGATKEHFDATVGIHPTAAEEFVTMREVRH